MRPVRLQVWPGAVRACVAANQTSTPGTASAAAQMPTVSASGGGGAGRAGAAPSVTRPAGTARPARSGPQRHSAAYTATRTTGSTQDDEPPSQQDRAVVEVREARVADDVDRCAQRPGAQRPHQGAQHQREDERHDEPQGGAGCSGLPGAPKVGRGRNRSPSTLARARARGHPTQPRRVHNRAGALTLAQSLYTPGVFATDLIQASARRGQTWLRQDRRLERMLRRGRLSAEASLYSHELVLPLNSTYAPWHDDREFREAYDAVLGSTRSSTSTSATSCGNSWASCARRRRHPRGRRLARRHGRADGPSRPAARPRRGGPLCDTFEGVAQAGRGRPLVPGRRARRHLARHVPGLAATRRCRRRRPHSASSPTTPRPVRRSPPAPGPHRRRRPRSARHTLAWAWPRLNAGGVVIWDDYGSFQCEGVATLGRQLFATGFSGGRLVHNLNGHLLLFKLDDWRSPSSRRTRPASRSRSIPPPERPGRDNVKIFADGADLETMVALAARSPDLGIHDQPDADAAAGVSDYADFARKILETDHRPARSPSRSSPTSSPRWSARRRLIASWGDNVYVKIPVTNTRGESTADVVRELSAEGVHLNVTALMTVAQVETVAAAARAATVHVHLGLRRPHRRHRTRPRAAHDEAVDVVAHDPQPGAAVGEPARAAQHGAGRGVRRATSSR